MLRQNLGDDLRRRAAGLLDHGDVEIALLVRLHRRLIDRRQAGALEEALDRLVGRADARPLALLALVGRAGRQAVDGQRQPARRGEGLGAFIDEAGIDQRLGDQLLQVLRRLPLHAGGNFLGEEFEQEIRHQRTAGGGSLLVERQNDVTLASHRSPDRIDRTLIRIY